MKPRQWLSVGLVALNVALGVALFNRYTAPAYAQARGRANFVITDGPNGYIYALDTNSGTLEIYQPTPKGLDLIRIHNVGDDFARVAKAAR